MCEMLGISAKRRREMNAVLREFFSHAERHPHGWGLARFGDGRAPSIEKEPVKATESELLGGILGERIEERTLLAQNMRTAIRSPGRTIRGACGRSSTTGRSFPEPC